MFAVLKSNSNDVIQDHSYCCHLSSDRGPAEQFLADRLAVSSNGLYSIVEVSSLDDLAKHVMPETEEVDVLADVLEKLEKLVDPANAEKFAAQIQEHSGKVVAEVKSMGIAGMKAVGDGFVALGDLIRKAGETKED